jgi:S1-C subfamily serine protease
MRRLIILLVLLLTAIQITHAQQPDLDRIQRAAVYVMQTQNIGGRPVITCVGSGTIVNRSGLIATNAHNTVPNTDCPGDQLVIALNIRPQEPPVPTYYAEIAQADEGLDLALLRITQELNGRLVDTSTLSLPFVELGDSSLVGLDDTITVVGYPSVQSEPATTYRGTITGFVAEPSGGERAWIKTDATIPGTMSGGGVFDSQGRLIGIPTTVPVSPLATESNCIALEDTTGDGLINRSDRCVPVGGFINALRPSNLVRPLLRGASLGIRVEKLQQNADEFGQSLGQPRFTRLFISTAVSDGMPTSVVRSLPTGTTSLYLFFDYTNMSPDTIYELLVTIDDIPSATFSLAPVRWSGGTDGLWYIGSSGQIWPNGTYNFTLFIDGLAADSTRITIGGPPSNMPVFRNIFFCIEDGENCYSDVFLLPTGRIVSARFIHQNIPEGTPWTRIWYYNGIELGRVEETWTDNGLDTRSIRLETGDSAPLPAGRYRLELYLEGRLAATSDFTIAGASEGAFSRVFSNLRFVTDDTARNVRSTDRDTSITNFPTGVQEIFTLFDWEQIAPGTIWTMRWSVDDVIFYEQTIPWRGPENGSDFTARMTGVNGVPDGSYRMELFVGPVRRGTVETEVGIGQLSIDQFAQTVGVQLNGLIYDAETGEGIPGVSFILISEDFSVEDFTWEQDQVYALAVTDRDGRFQLDRLLEYDAPYSVMIQADGYLQISGDGYTVEPATDNPLFVSIPLTRD